jgi:predicted secreted protein
VDEFIRFLSEDTIMLCGLGNERHKYGYNPSQFVLQSENRMNLVYNMIKDVTDQNGKKFNIIRLPFPECANIEINKEDGTYETLTQLYDKFPESIYALPGN